MTIRSRLAALTPVLAFALLFLPNQASAHGQGITFTATTTDGYIVDVDYGDVYIEAARIGRFDFRLFTDNTRQKQADFTDIWVRIARKDGGDAGRTLFAGSVAKQEFGGSGFSLVFSEGGTYTLSIRYNDASMDTFGETVGEAEFDLNVLPSDGEDTFDIGMEFWVGLLAGLLGASIVTLPFVLRNPSLQNDS